MGRDSGGTHESSRPLSPAALRESVSCDNRDTLILPPPFDYSGLGLRLFVR